MLGQQLNRGTWRLLFSTHREDMPRIRGGMLPLEGWEAVILQLGEEEEKTRL
jgi:hypothetical protein